MKISLEGLTLHVADVEASLAYYKEFPGAEVRVHRPGQFALLQIGTGRLGLLRHDGPMKFHMEFVPEDGDLDALHTYLSEHTNLPPLPKPETKTWGQRDIQTTDPDGNAVEFG